MKKDYFWPYLGPEIIRYGLILRSKWFQRESKCTIKQSLSFIMLLICLDQFIGYFITQKLVSFFIFVHQERPLKPIYMPKKAIFWAHLILYQMLPQYRQVKLFAWIITSTKFVHRCVTLCKVKICWAHLNLFSRF